MSDHSVTFFCNFYFHSGFSVKLVQVVFAVYSNFSARKFWMILHALTFAVLVSDVRGNGFYYQAFVQSAFKWVHSRVSGYKLSCLQTFS